MRALVALASRLAPQGVLLLGASDKLPQAAADLVEPVPASELGGRTGTGGVGSGADPLFDHTSWRQLNAWRLKARPILPSPRQAAALELDSALPPFGWWHEAAEGDGGPPFATSRLSIILGGCLGDYRPSPGASRPIEGGVTMEGTSSDVPKLPRPASMPRSGSAKNAALGRARAGESGGDLGVSGSPQGCPEPTSLVSGSERIGSCLSGRGIGALKHAPSLRSFRQALGLRALSGKGGSLGGASSRMVAVQRLGLRPLVGHTSSKRNRAAAARVQAEQISLSS